MIRYYFVLGLALGLRTRDEEDGRYITFTAENPDIVLDSVLNEQQADDAVHKRLIDHLTRKQDQLTNELALVTGQLILVRQGKLDGLKTVGDPV